VRTKLPLTKICPELKIETAIVFPVIVNEGNGADAITVEFACESEKTELFLVITLTCPCAESKMNAINSLEL